MPLCHRGWHRRPTAREHRGQGFRTRGGPAPASPARAPSPPPQAHTPARPQPITPVGTPRDRAEPARETPAIREPLRLGCFLDWWVAESLKQAATLGLSTASVEAMALSTAPALPPAPSTWGHATVLALQGSQEVGLSSHFQVTPKAGGDLSGQTRLPGRPDCFPCERRARPPSGPDRTKPCAPHPFRELLLTSACCPHSLLLPGLGTGRRQSCRPLPPAMVCGPITANWGPRRPSPHRGGPSWASLWSARTSSRLRFQGPQAPAGHVG